MKLNIRILSSVVIAALMGLVIVMSLLPVSAQEEPTPTPQGKGKDIEFVPGTPPASDGPSGSACVIQTLGSGTISSNVLVSVNGTWTSGCASVNRTNRYAVFYSFSVSQSTTVTIDLMSSTDAYLYLLSGGGTGGSVLEDDDDGGEGRNSRLSYDVAPGSLYTIEATTWASGETGDFTLQLRTSPNSVTPTPTPIVTCNILALGGVDAEEDERQEGSWASDCSSTSRPTSYARYYSFSVGATSNVQIDLISTQDTYLYLRRGATKTGTVLASDDNSGVGLNSRITRELALGTYTIEATTDLARRTGSFTLFIQVVEEDGSGTDPVDSCVTTDLGTFTGTRTRNGTWSSSCLSENREGKYAQFYSLSVAATSDIQIDLVSTDDPADDTYLYLITGTDKSGTVLYLDDDGGEDRNSRIAGVVTPEDYIIEATTFSNATIGGFTLTVVVTPQTGLTPPTGLSLSREAGDPNDLDLSFTLSGPPHYYQFELRRSETENGAYSSVRTTNTTVSPVDFDNQAVGYWYKVRGRNCSTSSRQSCSEWGDYTDPIELPSTLAPPTGLTIRVDPNDDDDLLVDFTRSYPHYYQFELSRGASASALIYLVVETEDASVSPARFANQTKGNWYRVRGRNCLRANRTGCGPWSRTTSSVELPDAILPPTGLSISIDSADEDNLRVSFIQSAAPHYYQLDLLRSNTETSITTIVEATENVEASPVVFTEPTKGFWYKARGRNCRTDLRQDCSDWSEVSNTIELPSGPLPPTALNLSVEVGDDNDLELTYTDSEAPHYYEFELHRSESQFGEYTSVETVNGANSPVAFDDLQKGYWYKAQGRNCSAVGRTGCGDWSAFSNAVELPLDPPTGVTTTVEANNDDLSVSYTRSSEPHYYEFELRSATSRSGSYTAVETKGSIDSPATFNYQRKGRWYKARGRNCGDIDRTTCGDWSAYSSAVQLPVDAAASLYDAPAPTGLRVTSTSATVVNLSWDAVSGASRYLAEYSTSASGPWAFAFLELSPRTSYKAVGLACETTYYFRIGARGDGTTYTSDYGAPSVGNVIGTTGDCPASDESLAPAPSRLRLAPSTIDTPAVTQTTVKLVWDAETDASGYLTQRSTSTSGPWSTVRFEARGNARNDSFLECGTRYYYRVRSKGDGTPYSTNYGLPTPVFPVTTSPCSPTVEIVGLETDVENGRADPFNVEASYLDSTTRYTIRVTTTNGDVGLNSTCSLRQSDVVVPSGRRSYSASLTLSGCEPSGGTVSATLLNSTTPIATAAPVGVAVTPRSLISVSPSDPFTGQRVTLRATVVASTYRWQEWVSGEWTDLSSTANVHRVESDSAAEKIFRLIVTYSSGKTEESAHKMVKWMPTSVSIKASPDYPQTNPISKRTVTLTATAEAPAGVTYQWQQDSGSGWANLDGPTSDDTKAVSWAARGTRKYQVLMSHSTATNATSETIHVTWDLPEIVGDLASALHTAIIDDSLYGTKQTALANCINTASGASGSIGPPNATSTTPLGGPRGQSTTFTSFDGIMSDYTGDTKALMDSGGNCHTEANEMFATVQSVTLTQLTALSSGNTDTARLYADLLATPSGRLFAAKAGDPDVLKLLAFQQASTPEEGASGAGEPIPSMPQPSRFGCLISTGEGENPPLPKKLFSLNCIVFATSHAFWVEHGDDMRQLVEGPPFPLGNITIGPFPWFSYGGGDVCTAWADGPRSACWKHDAMWGSLKKFVGEDSASELDRTWNPRNKLLADVKLIADVRRYGCDSYLTRPFNIWASQICGRLQPYLHSLVMSFGLNLFADQINIGEAPAWVYTQEELTHAAQHPQLFVECDAPRVVDGMVSGNKELVGWTFEASWKFDPGCVQDITIEEYIVSLSVVSNDGCSLPARLISRNSLDLVSRPDVWQVGDRSFTRFTAQELPGSCGETFDRAILHVAAKPNNIRWFSAEEHYHSAFAHFRVR